MHGNTSVLLNWTRIIFTKEENGQEQLRPSGTSAASSLANSGPLSILSYCAASILMTVTNKYVLSGYSFNLNFLLLAVQSTVCIFTIATLKSLSLITYREFNKDEARKWMPIALLLVAMIYTGSKALAYLSIPRLHDLQELDHYLDRLR